LLSSPEYRDEIETEESYGEHSSGSVRSSGAFSAGTESRRLAADRGSGVELLFPGQASVVLRAFGEGVMLRRGHLWWLRLPVNFVLACKEGRSDER
jgi:hypothetical protein